MALLFDCKSNTETKKPLQNLQRFSGADTQIRTGDLILTKDALYRLSYISIGNVWYISILF